MSDAARAPQQSMPREEAEKLLTAPELHRLLGLELLDWEEGRIRLRFRPPALARFGPNGTVHGGVLMTALDTAACFAVISSVGRDCSTVDLRADFLRPVVGSDFLVLGTALKVGRRLGRADAAITSDDGKIYAVARGTFAWEGSREPSPRAEVKG